MARRTFLLFLMAGAAAVLLLPTATVSTTHAPANACAVTVMPMELQPHNSSCQPTPTLACDLRAAVLSLRALRSSSRCTASPSIRLYPGGTYHLSSPITLNSTDGGTRADNRVIWMTDATLPPVPGQNSTARATISGAMPGFSSSQVQRAWRLSADPRLPAARAPVYELDLRATGLFAAIPAGCEAVDGPGTDAGRLELFLGLERQPLARFPNLDPDNRTRSYLRLGKTLGPSGLTAEWGAEAGARPMNWTHTPLALVRLHGYFAKGWFDDIAALTAINTTARTFTLDNHTLHYTPVFPGQWYFGQNLIEELDAEGEWFFDRAHAKLFFSPPAAASPSWPAQLQLSQSAGLLTLSANTSFLELLNIDFAVARGVAMVQGQDVHDIAVTNCSFVAGAGKAVLLSSTDSDTMLTAYNNRLAGLHIRNMGTGGVILDGGARRSLLPSNCSMVNSNITAFSEWKFTYSFGAELRGVGVRVANCEFSVSRHEALSMPGNDHIVEYSRFSYLLTEAHDAGAIHQGRDWTWRGRVVRYNLFDHLGQFAFYPGPDRSLPCNSPPTACIRCGLYMDDHEGGIQIHGNIFAGTGVLGVLSHNGRDIGGVEGGLDNNLFVGTSLGARFTGVSACLSNDNATLYQRLAAMPFQSALWAGRYPQLAKILDDAPCEPRNNAIGARAPNAAVDIGPITAWQASRAWFANASDAAYGGGWLSLPLYPGPTGPVFPESMFDVGPQLNWNGTQAQIGFAAAGDVLQTLNFTLRADSPLYARGWQRIPEELIGQWKRGLEP